MRELAYEPFKSGFFVSYSSVVFLNVIPIASQSLAFWGFISPVQDPRIGVSVIDQKPFTFQGKDPYLSDSSFFFFLMLRRSLLSMDSYTWGGVLPLARPCLCLSYSMLPFYPLLQRYHSFSFQHFVRGNHFIRSCRFLLSVGRCESRIFLCCHLSCSLFFNFLNTQAIMVVKMHIIVEVVANIWWSLIICSV